MAACGSLLSLLLVIFFIPYIPKQKEEEDKSSKSVINLQAIFRLILLPGVGIIMCIKLVCGIPIGILQSMFSGEEPTNFLLLLH